MMKAIVYTKYGPPDVLRLEEVEKPIPQDNEVLVKIYAASVNAWDWRNLRADPFFARFSIGLFRPKNTILGADIAGRVEAVGKNVTQLQPGDEVFGDIAPYGAGGFAEYVAVPESGLVRKPARLSLEESAAVPMAAITAMKGLRDSGNLQPGQKVLINGASGGVGTFAVQIAKAMGGEVTAVCSTAKMDMARSLGADYVIDYTQEDFTQSGEQYDLILAVNGYHPLRDYQRALTPEGTYVLVGGDNAQIFEALLLARWYSRRSSQNMTILSFSSTQEDLACVKELIEAGKVAPVIDLRFPLDEVDDAIRCLEAGCSKGKIIIKVAQEG
jgi:NADPH:quinone reductase-like Zn-dependent oxidoreductase